MPTLDWIGKKAVLNHHKEVPFHLLKCDPDLSVGDPESGNLLVQGDNLLALKALLPYYAGKVKCIYIDPPYNTGDENWVYNDAVNSLAIKEWLGKVVGKEFEDLSRHDKWLCMMYPRLRLLKRFLRIDGIIFVSIDENEVTNLKYIMDEIFGRKNLLGTLIWKRRSSSAMRGKPLSIDHEYVLVYAVNEEKASIYGLEKGVEGYPYKDSRGFYASTDLTIGMGKDARPNQFYPIKNPRTGKVYQANPLRVWRFFPDTMEEVIQDGLVIWPDDTDGNMERPRYKTYYDPDTSKPRPISSWIESNSTNDKKIIAMGEEYDVSILTSGMTQEGGRLLNQMFGGKVFDYPKPVSLVRSLIRAATKEDDLVMDSFAGTGTTAHAVLDLNKEDGKMRKFILVELENDICRDVTAKRLKKVILGYNYISPKNKKIFINGLGGGFQYCNLGQALFDASGQIAETVPFIDLARFVYFKATGQPLPDAVSAKTPLIGIHSHTAIYLLYNGILKDKTPRGGNALTRAMLEALPSHDGPKVVFGTSCRVGTARLKAENVRFRQIPYELKVD